MGCSGRWAYCVWRASHGPTISIYTSYKLRFFQTGDLTVQGNGLWINRYNTCHAFFILYGLFYNHFQPQNSQTRLFAWDLGRVLFSARERLRWEWHVFVWQLQHNRKRKGTEYRRVIQIDPRWKMRSWPAYICIVAVLRSLRYVLNKDELKVRCGWDFPTSY